MANYATIFPKNIATTDNCRRKRLPVASGLVA